MVKDERPSDIINFRCLLPKADFRTFYFEFETLLNKLIKYLILLNLNENAECFISIKKVNLFCTTPVLKIPNVNKINSYCVKGVHIRRFLWSAFFCIRTEYRKIRTRKISVFGHFPRSVFHDGGSCRIKTSPLIRSAN